MIALELKGYCLKVVEELAILTKGCHYGMDIVSRKGLQILLMNYKKNDIK